MDELLRRRLEIAFGLLILAALALFFVVGLSYPARPRELPLLVDGAGMALVLAHLIRVVRRPAVPGTQVGAAWNWKAVFICFASLMVYLGATLIIGMVLSSAIIVYGSGMAFGAQSRAKLGLLSAATVIAIHVLFVVILGVPLYRGLLGDLPL